MLRSRRAILLSAILAVFALSAVASSAASAVPRWHFGGTALSESETETVVGAAISSSLKVGTSSTTCQHFVYNMEVWNMFGEGYASVNELPLYECSTNAPGCTVSSMEAEDLPWPAWVETVSGKEYLEIFGIEVKIVYSGSSCSLKGTKILTGDAGGVINNSTSTATFDKETFEKTGTAMEIGGTSVEWTGEFPMEAFAKHRLEAVEVF